MIAEKRHRLLLASLILPALFLGILFHILLRRTETVILSDQAPTLVIVKDGEFEKYRGVSDIKGWLMRN